MGAGRNEFKTNLIIDNKTDTNIIRAYEKITVNYTQRNPINTSSPPPCPVVGVNILYSYFLRETLNVYFHKTLDTVQK